ncbi:MAG: DUF433 domain-containing protein [Mesorhizobium sp.]|uniref:DUF433 domain-containing protein n=1 Tax=unclassified Mesorhizobium TaxID=325217 RepID=UPI000FCAA6CF|nr:MULTISPECIES: DUF433 domain-containing protein [unclassified Mesorhizobium]RUW81788.1 DUF433 domain-containing protein [Mesorhizobium sp. M1E.F.Ca.ET.063.01.1.1]TIW11893.1 MAG: DUF433 domain-containing protein [Mesorhizobium sp.]
MLAQSKLLRTTEAAVVAGVDVQNVNKLIDDDILPKELFDQSDGRRVLPGGCVAINFYIHTAGILDAMERRRAIRLLSPRLRQLVWSNLAGDLEQDWTVHNQFVTIDFKSVFAETWNRLHRLAAAHDTVASDPHILGGTPVLKGTRVPVYAVAAQVAAGVPLERIREDYPSLDDEKIELAAIYAKANPPRGRPSPSRVKLPQGAKLNAHRSFRGGKAP